MKKLLTALTLSTLMLAGCGVFSSNHAWKEAKQENPLQIPPGMDRPSTTAALSIPPPSEPTESTASAPAASRSTANATQMHLSDDVDTAYKRVGLVLQQGDLGTVTAQDAAQHTYQLSLNSKPSLGTSQSFLQKHFSNLQQQQGTSSSGSGQASDAEQGGTTSVILKVTPAQGGGSTISASGDPEQAMRVIGVLSSRLGS